MVYALVRAENDDEAAGAAAGARAPERRGRRHRAARASACPTRRAERLRGEVTTVVHCAASVSFDLPLEESRRVNVEGTRRMVELRARAARRLERFTYVSTAYVAGEPRRPLPRGPARRRASASATPTSGRSSRPSWLLRERGAPTCPLQILRPSIVVGDSTHRPHLVLQRALRAAQGVRARRDPGDPGAARLARRHRAGRLRGRPRRTSSPRTGRTGPSTSSPGVTRRPSGRLLELSVERARAPEAGRPAAAPLPALAPSAGCAAAQPARSGSMEVYFPYFSMRVRFDDRRLGPGPPVEGYFHRLVALRASGRAGVGGVALPFAA